MAIATKSKTEAVEAILTGSGYPRLSLTMNVGGSFGASTYYPNGDVVRDIACYGSGSTMGAALCDLAKKWEEAALSRRTLRTASECKEAVIELIREHNAAPASFRDAVDALPVAR